MGGAGWGEEGEAGLERAGLGGVWLLGLAEWVAWGGILRRAGGEGRMWAVALIRVAGHEIVAKPARQGIAPSPPPASPTLL